MAISVDAGSVTEDLKRKAGYTFLFLSDPNLEVIKRYDLVHRGAGPDGKDISRPAEFLIDRSGIVRWRQLTDDYRVRARPEDMLAATKSLP